MITIFIQMIILIKPCVCVCSLCFQAVALVIFGFIVGILSFTIIVITWAKSSWWLSSFSKIKRKPEAQKGKACAKEPGYDMEQETRRMDDDQCRWFMIKVSSTRGYKCSLSRNFSDVQTWTKLRWPHWHWKPSYWAVSHTRFPLAHMSIYTLTLDSNTLGRLFAKSVYRYLVLFVFNLYGTADK